MSALNPRQQEAVRYTEGPLLVLAGAGSGKTSVITRKIAHLVQNVGLPARYIVAVTFTNKAAREMKERAGKLLKGSAAHGLTVSTFHNLGLNIIRKECAALGYKPGFSIFDDGDSKALLSEILHKEYAGDDGVASGKMTWSRPNRRLQTRAGRSRAWRRRFMASINARSKPITRLILTI